MKLPILSLLALTITGCAITPPPGTNIRSGLTRFHSWPASLNHPTFLIVNANTNLAGQLSDRAYRGHVAACLVDKGWRYSPEEENDVLVIITYALVGTRDYTTSKTRPHYGSTGGGTKYTQSTHYGPRGPEVRYGTVYEYPTFGITGYSDRTETHTMLGWRVTLDVYAMPTTHAPNPVSHLYQANLSSVDEDSHTLLTIVPGMFNELLREFPGKSPQSLETTIKLAELRPWPLPLRSIMEEPQ